MYNTKHTFYLIVNNDVIVYLDFTKSFEISFGSKFLTAKLLFLKSTKQMGLIRARMFGARHATGTINWCHCIYLCIDGASSSGTPN